MGGENEEESEKERGRMCMHVKHFPTHRTAVKDGTLERVREREMGARTFLICYQIRYQNAQLVSACCICTTGGGQL